MASAIAIAQSQCGIHIDRSKRKIILQKDEGGVFPFGNLIGRGDKDKVSDGKIQTKTSYIIGGASSRTGAH